MAGQSDQTKAAGTEAAVSQPARPGSPLTAKDLSAFAHKVFENNQALCARADQKLTFAFAVGVVLTGGLLPLIKPTADILRCSACPTWQKWAFGGLLVLSILFAISSFWAIYRGVFPAESRHPNLTGARELIYGAHISRRRSNSAYLDELRQLDDEGELTEWVNQAYEVGDIEARKMRRAKAALGALMLQGITEFSAWALFQAVGVNILGR